MARLPGRSSLTVRITWWFAPVLVALTGVLSLFVLAEVRRGLVSELGDGLGDAARVVRSELPEDPGSLQDRVRHLSIESGARITVIASDGSVLADSSEDPARMDNHAGRPEVQVALGGETGVVSRYSETTNQERLYVALPPDDLGRIVRLSVSEGQVEAAFARVRSRVMVAAVIAVVVGLAAVWLVARQVSLPIRRLTETADRMAGGDLGLRPARSPLREVDRLGSAIGGMADDLGRRVHARDEQRRTLETVLGALRQGVILLGDDEEVLYANPSAGALLGDVPARLSGLLPLRLQSLVRRARDHGEQEETVVEHGHPPRILRAAVVPFDDGGRALLVVNDITEGERVERMRRDFVADASHELKTPVASALSSIEALLIALDRDPGRLAGFAHDAEASVRRLSRIVADLLDLSRLESSPPSADPVRLDRVVEEEAAGLRERAQDAGIDLKVVAEPVTIMGARPEIALAVRNLCDNALRHTDPAGSVTVEVRRRDRTATVVVSDTGSGIPSRMLPRVFERFFRVDDARSRATGGTGLGLAIVKHVAERHGGRVSVESELGVGSTFRIDLPAAD